MTNTFATALNDAGQAHVAAELDRLELDWNVDATCSDIEDKISFGQLVANVGDSMDYEISNTKAGRKRYGVFACITILADAHVRFEGVPA